MFDLQNRIKLASTAQGALQRINDNNKVVEENIDYKRHFQKQIFEEYHDDFFENKIKLDTMFYKVMFENLNEEYKDSINHLLANMLTTTKQLYEHLNIKPKLYGFQENSLNESDDFLYNSAKRIINEFINNNYYSLTQEQRENKYLSSVRQIAGDIIISESVNEEEAIVFGTKTIIMHQLIEHINFPLAIRSNVEDLLSDENYGKIFEQNKLGEIWELFQEQSYDISKILATII